LNALGAAAGFVPLRIDLWLPLVIWLSLDAVRPRWASVGFPHPRDQQEAWIALLRRAIRRAAATRWTNPNAPSTLVADVLADATRELGESASVALMRFGRFTFAMGPGDHPELFAWADLFEACASRPPALETLVPWDDVRARIVEELQLSRMDRNELVLPLSSWDLAMFALRGIDDSERAAAEHPMRLCDWTARVTNARALWRAVLPLLDERRRDGLTWEGSRLGWSLGTLAKDVSLPDPMTLVETTR
jgi:hypothetical protein